MVLCRVYLARSRLDCRRIFFSLKSFEARLANSRLFLLYGRYSFYDKGDLLMTSTHRMIIAIILGLASSPILVWAMPYITWGYAVYAAWLGML